jgi:lactose/L-arabinose transport system ATP-binding protein
MATVELVSVNKSYGSVEVIHDLNLQIDDGSFTVFVGPSGCGKSTLLRMIAGLEPITKGEVKIDGRRVNDADPIDRGVAMVFQNYALYPHMTVEQNIGFSLKMAGLAKREIAERVADAARTLQVEEMLARKPAQLSGGQRQRVAIGRAIVRHPEVFLFDEPLSNLDAELRVSMRVEIAKLHRKLGATMIYVTHDQTEAMTLADSIVVVRGGQVEQVGAPSTLYEAPANLFVAGFIGSPRMNFLRGRAIGGTLALEAGPAIPFDTTAESEVLVGIRPEHFVVGDVAGPLEVRIEVVENLGGTRYLYGTTTHSNEDLVIEARDDHSIKVGETILVGYRPERVMAFVPEGARLRSGA